MRIIFYGDFDLETTVGAAPDLTQAKLDSISKVDFEPFSDTGGKAGTRLPSVCISYDGDLWHKACRSIYLLFNGKKWVAIEHEREYPDHIRDIEERASGPFDLNEVYGQIILNAYRIRSERLSEVEALVTSPQELERIASEPGRPIGR